MRILQGESTKPPPRSRTATPRIRAIWTLVAVLGGIIAIVGWIDAGIMWIGPDLADPDVLSGVIAAQFSALTIPTLGAGAVAVGVMGRGHRRIVRILAVGFLGVAALCITALTVYLTNLPPDGGQPLVVVRTVLYATLYVATYGWVTYYLWRETRVQAWP